VLRKIIFYPNFLDSVKFNIDPRIIQFAVLNNIHILFTFCKNINLHLTRNVAFGVRNNLHFTSNPSLPVKPVKNHSNIMSFIFRYFKTFSPPIHHNILSGRFNFLMILIKLMSKIFLNDLWPIILPTPSDNCHQSSYFAPLPKKERSEDILVE